MVPLDTIRRRLEELGNHHLKYLRTLERGLPELEETLEATGKNLRIHLWGPASSYRTEMALIQSLGGDTPTVIRRLSVYYALRFLRMNFRHQDILSLELAGDRRPPDAYRDFMMEMGREFRDLTGAFMESVLERYLPGDDPRDFFVCSVGTRADQDDIDVGVITSGAYDDEDLNRAVRRLAQHMLVHASPLHFHLSEHVGRETFTTSIDEYDELLKDRLQDVVIISELINGKRIFGSEPLFDRFQREIISRYYHTPGRRNLHHEGFLRGMLGEARALIVSPLRPDAVTPKEDGIRSLKLLLYAKKTVHGAQEVNSWDLLRVLSGKEPELREVYQSLHDHLSFLEMFRFQLQYYVVQEETYRLDEVGSGQLQRAARQMGYRDTGAATAWDQLVIDYYRHVEDVRRHGEILLEDLKRHLGEVSSFRVLFDERPDDLAGRIADQAAFFEGTRFWDDVLERLESSPDLLDLVLEDLQSRDEEERDRIIDAYIGLAEHSPLSVLRLLTMVAERLENEVGETVYHRMNSRFLAFLQGLPYGAGRLARIYSHYPRLIHAWLLFLPEESYPALYRVLQRPVHDESLSLYQEQMMDLCRVHEWSGQYFHRFLARVVSRHPEYLSSMDDLEQLARVSEGLLATLDAHPDPSRRKEILGDYYDLEFLRVGIGTLKGRSLEETNREFTAFCDRYMRHLFEVCAEEAAESIGWELFSDRFVILAAGGHARQQAYDDDYDLIALTEHDDERTLAAANRLMALMNRELLRRGLLPHYRLADVLGRYASPLGELEAYLAEENPERFIDCSQLLGARLIVGGQGLNEELISRILRPFIFDRKDAYIGSMIEEVRSRRGLSSLDRSDGHAVCNLKESPGGLRDIEAMGLILKAWLEIPEPLSQHFFRDITPRLPDMEKTLADLDTALARLRTVRDLHRIAVAAEDAVHIEDLHRIERIAEVRVARGEEQWRPSPEAIEETLRVSAEAADTLMDHLEERIGT
ncbi:MAG: hypothetical protein R6W82_04145 [bacterium]